MAEARVSARLFERGEFPGVCALTGGPADNVYHVRLAHVPAWAWWLFAAGVVPGAAAVAWFRARAQLRGGLPFAAAVVRRSRTAGIATRIAVVGAIAAVVSFLLAPSGAVGGLVAIALAATAFAARESERWNVGGYVDRETGAVVVTNVHPRFAAAAEAQSEFDEIERMSRAPKPSDR